jgi:hypothetical protein
MKNRSILSLLAARLLGVCSYSFADEPKHRVLVLTDIEKGLWIHKKYWIITGWTFVRRWTLGTKSF